MTRARIIFDWPAWSDPRRVEARDRALASLLEGKPDWADVRIMAAVPPNGELKGYECFSWSETGQGVASDRPVPYLHHVIAAGGDTEWVGYINADCTVMPKFWSTIEEHLDSELGWLLFHRIEVGSFERWKEGRDHGVACNRTYSIDGFLIRPEVWHSNRIRQLDYVVTGEPYWDTLFMRWCEMVSGAKGRYFDILVHENHQGGWAFDHWAAGRANVVYYWALSEHSEQLKGSPP